MASQWNDCPDSRQTVSLSDSHSQYLNFFKHNHIFLLSPLERREGILERMGGGKDNESLWKVWNNRVR